MIRTLSGRPLRPQATPASAADDYLPPDLSDAAYYAEGRATVADVLQAYPYATTPAARVEAITEFVARHFIHPGGPGGHLHVGVPAGTRREQLPAGKERADIWTEASPRTQDDNLHWDTMTAQAILGEMLGTYDAGSQTRGTDGLMSRVSAGRYRIKDLGTYRTVQCTIQHRVARYLIQAAGAAAAVGREAVWGNCDNHDPMQVYMAESNGWVWYDATFGEVIEDAATGRQIGLLELYDRAEAARQGQPVAEVVSRKLRPPSYASSSWIGTEYDARNTYVDYDLNRFGPTFLGLQLNESQAVSSLRFRHLDCAGFWASGLSNQPTVYVPSPRGTAFPHLGLSVRSARPVPGGVSFEVVPPARFPDAQLERRAGGGAWERCGGEQTRALGSGAVAFRAVDALGAVLAAETLVV